MMDLLIRSYVIASLMFIYERSISLSHIHNVRTFNYRFHKLQPIKSKQD